MLQHMVRKPKRIVGYVSNLAHKDVIVLLIICSLVQGDQAMSHGAGIHGPHSGQPQVNEFVNSVLQQIQVLFFSRFLISLADAVIRHPAGPVPGQIHIHGFPDNLVDHLFDLFLVILQSQHMSLHFLPPGRHDSFLCFILTACQRKEMSANSPCKPAEIFIVFPGFYLNILQRLFSDSS